MSPAGPTVAAAAGSLDNSLPTMYSEFKLLEDVVGVARSSSTEYKLLPHTGATKNINNYGRVLAVGLADAVDYGQAQALTDASTPATPSEVGVLMVVSGRSISRVQDPDVMRRIARVAQNAINLKQDTDGVNQLASFTATTIGASGNVASPGQFVAASGLLGVGMTPANPEPAPKPWFAITHDWALVPVMGRMVPLGTTGAGGTVYIPTSAGTASSATVGMSESSRALLREGIGGIGSIGQILIKADANLIPDATPNVTGAAFSKEGMVFVSEVESTMDTDMPKRLRGGAEVMAFCSYVFTNYRAANYGVTMLNDATRPLS